MKLLVFRSLLVLMLFSAIAPVNVARSQNISVFNLAHLARQGYFRKHGIPGHSALCAAVMTRRVSVRDVVKAAISENRLSPEMLDNKSYLKHLEVLLRRSCQRI